MEQDLQLKEILMNSAESASADFTNAVMQKVQGLAAAPLNYKPLVSPKLERLFIITFGALIAAILGLCLIITMTNPEVLNWIQNMEFPELNYKRIFTFIIMFWILFTFYRLLEKKFLLGKNSSFETP